MNRSFRTILRGPARSFYERASAESQRKLDAIFDLLEADPTVDGAHKFHYTRLIPVMAYAYADDDYHIVYQLTSHDPPNWEEWEVDHLGCHPRATASGPRHSLMTTEDRA